MAIVLTLKQARRTVEVQVEHGSEGVSDHFVVAPYQHGFYMSAQCSRCLKITATTWAPSREGRIGGMETIGECPHCGLHSRPHRAFFVDHFRQTEFTLALEKICHHFLSCPMDNLKAAMLAPWIAEHLETFLAGTGEPSVHAIDLFSPWAAR